MLDNERALAKWEDRWLEPPEYEDKDENEMWLRADEEADERRAYGEFE